LALFCWQIPAEEWGFAPLVDPVPVGVFLPRTMQKPNALNEKNGLNTALLPKSRLFGRKFMFYV
jgi:hypothetical protein